MITYDYLISRYIYNPLTGLFYNLKGNSLGWVNKGYILIAIKNRHYFIHRLAWLYMTGKWPKNEIDHINRIKNDNRWENLREATRIENGRNVKKSVGGIYIQKSGDRYMARVHLGYFSSEDEAREACVKALDFKGL